MEEVLRFEELEVVSVVPPSSLVKVPCLTGGALGRGDRGEGEVWARGELELRGDPVRPEDPGDLEPGDPGEPAPPALEAALAWRS